VSKVGQTVEVYSFEDSNFNQFGDFTTMDYKEAEEYASQNSLILVANIYEWQDSEIVKNYTPDEEEDAEGGESSESVIRCSDR
jgi:hypothetical protein